MSDESPEGTLIETRFGLRYEYAEQHTAFEVIDLHRKSGELWGELTVRCDIEGVRGQLDGNRLRQGNFNFSSLQARTSWAKALTVMSPKAVNDRFEWGNLLERVCQAVLDHEQQGSIHGQQITGKRVGAGGRPWAAYPIIPAGEVSTIYARGGAGKTSFLATLAFGMALGRSLVPGVRVDRPYRVAILDWETNIATAEDLWGLISETHHVAVPDGVWYEPMEVPIERSLQKVATILDKSRADLVIIDSVGMALLSSGDFSDPAEAITRVYQSLRRLGTWGVLIDHVTGSDLRGKRVAMKAYGSIYKLNLARHAIALHISDRSGETANAYLACPKSNVMRDQWAMAGTLIRSDTELRWDFRDGPDYDLYDRLMSEPDDTPPPPEKVKPPTQGDMVMALLKANPGGMSTADLATALRLETNNIRSVCNRLNKEGMVEEAQIKGKTMKLWYRSVDLAAATDELVDDGR